MFTVRPTARHVNARGAEILTEVLCMYDNAGEHFLPGADSLTSPTTQHLAQSKNIFFLFDPTQDVRFRSRLHGLSEDPQVGQVLRAFRQDNVLLEMAARIRRHAGMPADEKLRQPLTIVVTKSDIWQGLLPGIDIKNEPYQFEERASGLILGRVKKDFIEMVSQQIENLLAKTVPEFVSAVNDISAQALYIPVSATGGSTTLDPKSGLLKVRASDVKPAWVTVPFCMSFLAGGKLLDRFVKKVLQPSRRLLMAYELFYTSAPKGLRPLTSGICTVGMTRGFPGPFIPRLEALSGYRPPFEGRYCRIVQSHIPIGSLKPQE